MLAASASDRVLRTPLAVARSVRARARPPDALSFLQRLARSQGDVARVPLGLRDLLFLRHPDHVQEVLVQRNASFQGLRLARALLDEGLLSVDGERHKRQRAMMRPAFHGEALRGYASLACGAAQRWEARWQDGQRVDMAGEMMRLTLDVTGQSMLGADRADQARELGEALIACLDIFRASPLAPWTTRWPTPSSLKFRRDRARVDALMERILAERRAGPPRADMLGMLLEARDEEGQGMDDKQVRDEALTLLVAGHETTALALSWAWHGLAQTPAAQARLHQELDEVLRGRPPGIEDLPRLPYLRRVLSEAMRMNPPVWAIGRKAVEPVEVGGVKLRAGSVVVVSPYVTQHDPRWWPAPESFEPDRFLPEAAKGRPKFAYFPFGGGPRACLGEPLAWLEASLLLGTLAQRWRVAPLPGEVRRHPLLTLQPRDGLPLRLEARAPAAG